MKHLILFLLMIGAVAKGQETQSQLKAKFDSCRAIDPYSLHLDTYIFDFGDKKVWRIVEGSDTSYGYNPFEVYGLSHFVQLYRQYAQECWNDSTATECSVYNYSGQEYVAPRMKDEIDPGMNPAYRGTRTVYFHSGATFDGFMNWIERNFK